MGWIAPVQAGLSQQYGVKNSAYEAGYHTGLDYSISSGTRIVAVQKGKVVESGWNDSYGNYVKVRHPNGYYSLYAHLNTRAVKVGTMIRQGAAVGRSGSTGNSSGPHLHFEVRAESGYGSDINPYKFIGKGGKMADNKSGGGGGGGGTGGGPPRTSKGEYGFNEAFLDEHPEIRKLTNKAFNNKWTVERFQAEVKNTRWWENTTKSQRAYQLLEAEEPEELKRQIELKKKDLDVVAEQMGVDVNNPALKDIATKAIRNNWSDNEIAAWMARQFDMTVDRSDMSKKQRENKTKAEEQKWIDRQQAEVDTSVQTGLAGDTLNTLQELSRDYGINLSAQTQEKMVKRVLRGEQTPDTLRQYFIRQAQNLYPTIAEQLNEGMTVDQMLDTYRDIAAQELGMMPDAMDPDNKKWTAALTEGKNGMMTADEWTRTLRQDQRYGYDKSNSAREQASQMVLKFGQIFGAA